MTEVDPSEQSWSLTCWFSLIVYLLMKLFFCLAVPNLCMVNSIWTSPCDLSFNRPIYFYMFGTNFLQRWFWNTKFVSIVDIYNCSSYFSWTNINIFSIGLRKKSINNTFSVWVITSASCTEFYMLTLNYIFVNLIFCRYVINIIRKFVLQYSL